MIPYAPIVHAAARRYFWPGATREDVEQEALYALVKAKPSCTLHAKVVVTRHLIEQVRRETRRRPQLVAMVEEPVSDDFAGLIENRERLRRVLATTLTDLERHALGRSIRGESITETKSIDNALQRARRKLAA